MVREQSSLLRISTQLGQGVALTTRAVDVKSDIHPTTDHEDTNTRYAMQHKAVLSQSEVSQILQAARSEAQQQGWAVAIAVVDDGGHPLALERLDGCAPIGAYIATEKARSAAIGRRETKGYEDMVNGGRSAFLSAPLITSLEGGVPVLVDGQVVGAVGVSGVKAEQDAQVAKAGIAAL